SLWPELPMIFVQSVYVMEGFRKSDEERMRSGEGLSPQEKAIKLREKALQETQFKNNVQARLDQTKQAWLNDPANLKAWSDEASRVIAYDQHIGAANRATIEAEEMAKI